MTKAIVFLAEGTEEMEFSIAYDVLVRGGVDVKSVYVPAAGAADAPPNGLVKASRGVQIGPDMTLTQLVQAGDVGSYDALIVPGGVGGAQTIGKDETVLKMLSDAYQGKRLVGAICAGSLAALHAKIGLKGPITSHPSVADQLSKDYEYSEDHVVVTDHLVTSRGPGTSFAFALTLLEKLEGAEVRNKVAAPMVLQHL
ncbi:protein deglycase [Malassezia japonica]|uniref:D-lactate dehydratase n=1 Tax=Malassezia japonica TaxID=223818 RepID=A0AAF0JB64_9BASI|nr:protein deglycase [Malassezia japonica]WFD40587.1 protein deglycase [Malassezia japonica]